MPTAANSQAPTPTSIPLWWHHFLPRLVLFLLTASLTITRTGRDVIYVRGGGVRDLPLAYLSMSVLAPAVAMAVLAAMVKWGSQKVRLALPIATAIFLLSAPAWATSRPALAFLFIFIPVVFGVILSTAWLFAAESAPTGRARRSRSFAMVGAASMLGSIAGAGVARILAARAGPAQYLTIGAVVLLLASALIASGRRSIRWDRPAGMADEAVPPISSLKLILSEGVVRSLMSVVVAASATGVLVEYLFYMSASAAQPSLHASTRYFAGLYFWLNSGGLALQLLVQPTLQRRLGLGKSLMFVPMAVCVTSLLFAVRFLPAAAVRIVEGGLKSSFYRSGWEQSYTLVAKDLRAMTKVLIDGVASRLGEGAAAVGLMIGAAALPVTWNRPAIITAALVCVVLAWAVSVNALRRMIAKHEACVAASEDNPEEPPMDCCVLTATLGRRLV